jgi:hypothetical protein
MTSRRQQHQRHHEHQEHEEHEEHEEQGHYAVSYEADEREAQGERLGVLETLQLI